MSYKSTQLLEEAAVFLLEVPPLEEVNGSIAGLIERYRCGVLNKQDALENMLDKWQSYVEAYVALNNEISNLLE
jgi:hypothetical protein